MLLMTRFPFKGIVVFAKCICICKNDYLACLGAAAAMRWNNVITIVINVSKIHTSYNYLSRFLVDHYLWNDLVRIGFLADR